MKADIKSTQSVFPDFKPGLAIVQVCISKLHSIVTYQLCFVQSLNCSNFEIYVFVVLNSGG